MSFEAMGWATKQRPQTATAKLALLIMASMANQDGECYPSHQYLADQCLVSRRTMINTLRILEDLGMITTVRRFKDNVKTSNLYKVNSNVQILHKGSADPAQGGSADPAHKTVTPLNSQLNVYPPEFLKLWEIYPRKVGKKAALKAFKRVSNPVDQLIKDITYRMKSDKDWQDPDWCIHLSTYLNGERWEDSITPVSEQRARLPNRDEELIKWASARGLREARTGESWPEYRQYLEGQIQ